MKDVNVFEPGNEKHFNTPELKDAFYPKTFWDKS
jgi:hypothetical protein